MTDYEDRSQILRAFWQNDSAIIMIDTPYVNGGGNIIINKDTCQSLGIASGSNRLTFYRNISNGEITVRAINN